MTYNFLSYSPRLTSQTSFGAWLSHIFRRETYDTAYLQPMVDFYQYTRQNSWYQQFYKWDCVNLHLFSVWDQNIQYMSSEWKEVNTALPWNKFVSIMITQSLHPSMSSKPVNNLEVFVNYFIGATNNAKVTHISYLSYVACCMEFILFCHPLKSSNIK